MKNAILVLVALVTATLLGNFPVQAAAWCAVYSTGRSSHENCGYRDFETCRMEIIAGNRGFCRPSQYSQGYAYAPRSKKSRKQAER